MPALGQQFLVSAHLPHLAFVHHDDLVRALHGRKPMRNDHRSPAFDHAAKGFAHPEFGLGIDAGGSFIENQDLRIVRQGASKRNQLLLSGRKRAAAFPHFLLESCGRVRMKSARFTSSAAFSTSSSSNPIRAESNVSLPLFR